MNKWLTLITNVGVIAGIVFLAIEINQNTQTLRAAAIQNSTGVARQQLMLLAQLTEDEGQRSFLMDRSFVIGMQGLYRQWTTGVLPDEEWEMWTRIICWNAEDPAFQELWPGNAAILIPAFVDFVEATCDVPTKDSPGD